MVSVRLTPAELDQVQEAAGREGMTVAAFMRERALEGGGYTCVAVANRLNRDVHNATIDIQKISILPGTVTMYTGRSLVDH
ncbi:hypothetical protein SAMN04489867_0416 [Pedococcus dokdonensis]|uniref:Uncharacterized protein n=2 Tax=Pedococcus dokdonensis TaxID=443156 RepID=A0A1H0LVY8_9MICO|nr:hypothetical protein SAMN04489867_0416 [Pedococcus dokdonensis]